MPRNSGGTYTSPIPPFSTGSTILSQPMNQKFADIDQALSESLSRFGQGAMMTQLKLQDGSTAQPGLTFDTEPGLGLYRGGNSSLRVAAAGSILQEWNLTLTTINRPVTVTNPIQDATGLTSVGNGTGHGAVLTGGTPTGNVASGAGLVTTGGAVSGSGGGGPGLRATGTGTSVAAEFNGGIRVNSSPLGAVNGTETLSGVLADVVMVATGDYNPACVLRALIPTQTYKNEINARVKSKVANATLFQDVAVGLSGDVSGTVGLIGQFWFDADAPMIYRSIGSPASAVANTAALALGNGNLRMDGANLNSNIAAKNTLAPSSLPKVWGSLSVGGGANGALIAVPAQAGFGIGSATLQDVSIGGATIRVLRIAFATPFINTTYAPRVDVIGAISVSQAGGTGGVAHARVTTKTTAYMDVLFYNQSVDPGGPTLDTDGLSLVPGNGPLDLAFQVFGFQ